MSGKTAKPVNGSYGEINGVAVGTRNVRAFELLDVAIIDPWRAQSRS